MAKNGSLNYYKQYIVNPGTDREAKYDDLFEIRFRDNAKDAIDNTFYAVCIDKRDDKTHCKRWGIINSAGDYTLPVEYIGIGHVFEGPSDAPVLYVQTDEGHFNLVNLKMRRVFKEDYRDFTVLNGPVCIVYDDNDLAGLGDIVTGKIIMKPQYHAINQLSDSGLFQCCEEKEPSQQNWGILDRFGEFVYLSALLRPRQSSLCRQCFRFLYH